MRIEQELRRASGALSAGRAGDAAALLKEIVWRHPENARAYTLLGVALHQAGESRQALDAFERAHYLQPGNAVILYNYGAALRAAGREEEARLRWEAALRLAPDYAEPRAALAESLSSGPHSESSGGLPAKLAPAGASRGAAQPREQLELPLILPSDEELIDPYNREGPPRFSDLTRDALTLFVAAPHLPFLVMLPPLAGAAAWQALANPPAAYASLCWVAAVAAGGAIALPLLANLLIFGSPMESPWPLLPRVGRTALLLAPGFLLPVGLTAWMAAERSQLPPYAIALGALLLMLFFHAVMAPAYMQAASEGPGGFYALGIAMRVDSRAWLYVGVMLAAGTTAGGILVFFAWLYVRAMGASGGIVEWVVQATMIASAAAVWMTLTAVCGMDAVVLQRATAQPPEDRRPAGP